MAAKKTPPTSAKAGLLGQLWEQIPRDDEAARRLTLDKGWPALKTCVERLLAGKPEDGDLWRVLRQAQVDVLRSVVDVLDEGHPFEKEDPRWGLFVVDEDDAPIRSIGELHGEFMRMDPAGRMGEPEAAKPSAAKPSAKKKKAR